MEILLEIRQDMAREADYDIDLFCELVRSGVVKRERRRFSMGSIGAELTDREISEDA
ncbi:MAG: hypothetical protein H0V76_07490 [Blastocatellia bacterium]|nr:hypothetical protein [Blastocatellia bacterium]